MSHLASILKAILISVIVAGMVIASFYVAYLFLIIIVLAGVGIPAYLYSKFDKKLRKPYYHA